MERKCSNCGNKGHNSRTCTRNRRINLPSGVKLFGVQLNLSCSSNSFPIKKSLGIDSFSSPSNPTNMEEDPENLCNGYLSDDGGLLAPHHKKKKGVPWTEEEHRMFLEGLKKLGKGDWRGISRNYVTTRTPTQVASHAQKYFLRMNSLDKRNRRASLFDVRPDEKFENQMLHPRFLEPLNDDDDDDDYDWGFWYRESTQMWPNCQRTANFKRQLQAPDLELSLAAPE